MSVTTPYAPPTEQGLSGRRRVSTDQEHRRHDLAVAAVETWSEHGYAHVSVRNVAKRTRFSHGMVHYYFASKDELVAECVEIARQGTQIDAGGAIEAASDVAGVTAALTDALCASLAESANLHRIRYDLRNQSLFDEELREHSEMLQKPWEDALARMHARLAELGADESIPAWIMDAQIDGMFQRAVRKQTIGDSNVSDELKNDLQSVLPVK
ncbi:TetR/AcrR family transcriptional regulator [Rudaeicoccus suwonensis]|uniref:TetR family transcriptional regulator n=1 Tax=Rudaeicoccus suwonensis TaxID=657409 RepID=A0A561E474_9MICO|nr:TetR/AcrR family transcriptional regulator [Rudaeicoccus suwonensis]TWE10414.1 TetR family transcriptional regulator [Rudaeicoccus suwonensis]